MQSRTIIGIISDTHGLARAEALDALRGSDFILHAGDLGSADILQTLEDIAPTIAVRGNVDGEWASDIPVDAVVEVGEVAIYVLHDLKQMDLKPETSGFAVVVSGHTHQPKQERKNGVLYFNPGSAGPRRFSLPVSVGRLTVEGNSVQGELITLE